MTGRPGVSLVELAVAIVVFGLLAAALAGVVRSATSAARTHAARTLDAEAVRVPTTVLRRELRTLDPRADVAAVARDTLTVRAVRGGGVVCGREPDALTVRYRGVRAPDPDKDSVLLVDALSGVEIAAALAGTVTDPDGCAPYDGETVYRWTTTATAPPGTVVLLFESGSYHLVDRAFRYRRGLGGRQPLTTERIDVDGSGFAWSPDGTAPTGDAEDAYAALEITVRTHARAPIRSAPAPTAIARRVRIEFPNGPAPDRGDALEPDGER